jgi:very-short-patch-repair endonuclease
MSENTRKFRYDPRLRSLARQLRKDGTLGEVLLWNTLKGRALGYEFHRQLPIGNYIVDFFCNERMLAIEIDGKTHLLEEVYEHDIKRQEELEALGIRFLRFQEKDVRRDIQAVTDEISRWLRENK